MPGGWRKAYQSSSMDGQVFVSNVAEVTPSPSSPLTSQTAKRVFCDSQLQQWIPRKSEQKVDGGKENQPRMADMESEEEKCKTQQ